MQVQSVSFVCHCCHGATVDKMVEFATLLLVAAFFLSARAAIVEIEEGRILGSELK